MVQCGDSGQMTAVPDVDALLGRMSLESTVADVSHPGTWNAGPSARPGTFALAARSN